MEGNNTVPKIPRWRLMNLFTKRGNSIQVWRIMQKLTNPTKKETTLTLKLKVETLNQNHHNRMPRLYSSPARAHHTIQTLNGLLLKQIKIQILQRTIICTTEIK